MKLTFTADENSNGRTVKQILKSNLGLSERLIKKLKFSSNILLNSIPVHVNAVVKQNDIIEANIDFVESCDGIAPENIAIDIIYEDDCLIALNKQPHIVVHPTSTHQNGTVANALLYHYRTTGTERKIRPVSRLDRDTTGIIIFAKNEFVQEALIRQMSDKTFRKEYVGIVNGILKDTSGTIALPIERKPGSIMLRHTADTGAPAVTHYTVLEHLNDATFARFSLETGRTHQIRVHCQAIGHPLAGDTLYSSISTDIIDRQALHSQSVSFIHPYSGKYMSLNAPIPGDMLRMLEILRK